MKLTTKKICFFNTTKAWGGGEKWHFDMASHLHETGYDVVVFTNKKSVLARKLENTTIPTINIKITNLSFLNPFKILYLKKIFELHKIEFIIINLSADLKIAGIAAKLAKIEHIIYRRGSAIAIRNNFLNRYIFKNIVTNVLANSEETKKTINQNYPKMFDINKIAVIYNGIDIQKWDINSFKTLYQRRNDEIILGNAGRLEYQKNQKALIKIAKILKTENVNFTLLIAGEGRMKNELIQLSINEGVEDKIVFLEFVENIKDFMESIDIFLLTSFWEGFGFVLAEAMASKKSIIAFAVSSNPELVIDNYNGNLVAVNDISDFAVQTKNLILNKEVINKYGEAGRKLLEEKFDINICRQKFITYLEQLISK